jgi:hypothetical protein
MSVLTLLMLLLLLLRRRASHDATLHGQIASLLRFLLKDGGWHAASVHKLQEIMTHFDAYHPSTVACVKVLCDCVTVLRDSTMPRVIYHEIKSKKVSHLGQINFQRFT